MFWVPQIVTWADIGLAVGGFVVASKSEHGLDPTVYTKASFGLFAALYLFIVYMFWCFWSVRKAYARDEKRGITCVGICLPLLAVRTAYSLIFQITADRTWNAVKGNPTAYLFGTFLPELAIIYMCIWTIMRINPPPRGIKDGKGTEEPLPQTYAHVDSRPRARNSQGDNIMLVP